MPQLDRVQLTSLVALALLMMGVPAGWTGQALQVQELLTGFATHLVALQAQPEIEMAGLEVVCSRCRLSLNCGAWQV